MNTSKTKIVIFSRGKVRNRPVFTFGEDTIETTDDYKYLGCIFNYNGRFRKTINERVCNARRAMYSLLSKSNLMNLPLDITCELFDSLVTPVLLYGCEIWGIESIAEIETFHVKFCKRILKLNKNTANCMALGELGRLKLKRIIDKRMISFWCKLVSPNDTKISSMLFKLSKEMYEAHVYEPKWLIYVKNVIDNCGFSNMWNISDPVPNLKWLQSALHLKIDDMARQNWASDVTSNSLCVNYRIFKSECCYSQYLNILSNKDRISLCKFRCSNHKLAVNTGRYENINRNNRICTLCNSTDIGDEYHYIFSCPAYREERERLIKPYYITRPNTYKFHSLFNSSNRTELTRLSAFVRAVMP